MWRKFLTGLVRFSSSGGIAVPGCKVTSCGLGQTGRDVGLAFYVMTISLGNESWEGEEGIKTHSGFNSVLSQLSLLSH